MPKAIAARLLAAVLAFAPIGALADTIVLVHGAFQDGRVWSAVTPLLESRGHKVVVVDLPGRPANPADPRAMSLNVYRDAVIAAIGPGTEPVTLVGHSFGGFTIAAVAEAMPRRVASAVFLAAYLPRSGESMQALAQSDRWNKFSQENFVIARDYATATVLERDRALIFCEECAPAQRAVLLAGMVDEPLKPAGEAIALTAAFDGVRKVYVATSRDNAVSRPLQRMMIERASLARTLEIDSGHAPAISNPAAVAEAILAAISTR